MSTFWIASLASLATLLGGWGVVRFLQGRAQFMRLLSGVAAGYLLSVTVVRIIPECLEAKGGEINAYWVLAGYLLVHVMEHGITLHFHYGEETHTNGSPLSGVLALEGRPHHIRVLEVCPGPTDTDIWAGQATEPCRSLGCLTSRFISS